MSIERLLQIHVACLTAMGTLLLGMGQRSPVLPVLAIFAAITSVIFTDRLRWFRLNTLLGTIAAFGGQSDYLTRDSDRWYLPRFVFGPDWNSRDSLLALLDGAR